MSEQTKVVPVEPTEKMREAAWNAYLRIDKQFVSWRDTIYAIYKAMLAATPQPTDAVLAAQSRQAHDPDTKRGLYDKYAVRRLSDPTGKHANCEYFVLDLVHDEFAPDALDAYADACKTAFPILAYDLREKAVTIAARFRQARGKGLPGDAVAAHPNENSDDLTTGELGSVLRRNGVYPHLANEHAVSYGHERQDYLGGPVYRVGTSTGVSASELNENAAGQDDVATERPETDSAPAPAASPTRSGPNTDVICFAPGDRCAGCDHYYGKAKRCKYAPMTIEDSDLPERRQHPRLAEPPATVPAASPLPLSAEQVELERVELKPAIQAYFSPASKLASGLEFDALCNQAAHAIELRDENRSLVFERNAAFEYSEKAEADQKALLADIERLVEEAYKRDADLARYEQAARELPEEPPRQSAQGWSLECPWWYADKLRTFATAAVSRAEKDAERYRWLKAEDRINGGKATISWRNKSSFPCKLADNDDLDALIDAAQEIKL